MAVDCINQINAKQVYMTYGTPYHTGKIESFEEIIADRVDAVLKNKLRLNINGCIIDVRHKIGGSTIPHGRFTQIAKEAMWDDLKNIDKAEKANVIIRSHVHYHVFGGHSNNRIFFTTPALQGWTEYGDRECSGSVDYGFITFDIDEFGLIHDFKFYKALFNTNINEIINVDLRK
jgi:hypothetical protein